MKCIKTGCDAFLVEYGEWVHGDAFQTDGGDLVIRCCARSRKPEFGAYRHFTVDKISHWFDDDKTSMVRNSTLFANLSGYASHGYRGVPEPALQSD